MSKQTTELTSAERKAMGVFGTVAVIGFVSFKIVTSVFGGTTVHAETNNIAQAVQQDNQPSNSISARYDDGFNDYADFEEQQKKDADPMPNVRPVKVVVATQMASDESFHDIDYSQADPSVNQQLDQAMRQLNADMYSGSSISTSSTSSSSSSTSGTSSTSSTSTAYNGGAVPTGYHLVKGYTTKKGHFVKPHLVRNRSTSSSTSSKSSTSSSVSRGTTADQQAQIINNPRQATQSLQNAFPSAKATDPYTLTAH